MVKDSQNHRLKEPMNTRFWLEKSEAELLRILEEDVFQRRARYFGIERGKWPGMQGFMWQGIHFLVLNLLPGRLVPSWGWIPPQPDGRERMRSVRLAVYQGANWHTWRV